MSQPAEKEPEGAQISDLGTRGSASIDEARKLQAENAEQRERLRAQNEKIRAQGAKSLEQRDKLKELKERNKKLQEQFEEQRVTLDVMKLSAATNTAEAGEAARKIREARKRLILLRLFFGVILPFALSIAYYGFIASDRFESTALFNIQAAEGHGGSSMDSLFGVLPGVSPAGRDTLTVRDFILSRDVLKRLEKDHQFISHYKDQRHDFLSRLSADASLEDAFEYYQDVVRLDYDTTSGVLSLVVTAYTAEAAQRFSQALLGYSEEAVNSLNDRARKDQTIFAEKELKLAEDRLGKARSLVLKLQAERGEFSPESSASEALSVRQSLEVALANARAELMSARSYMADTAPQVIALQQKVNSLSVQAKRESKRLVDPGKEGGLNTSMAEFESAIFEKELAQRGYTSAVASLEIARQNAARQHRYLVTIAKPIAADESTKPDRVLGIFTVLMASILLLGIGTLLYASIREHAKI